MKKGQAFDTMMLVISVIVAVAILGVLLSFLAPIDPGMTNAKAVIPDLVKSVSSAGFGNEARENIDFKKDLPIYSENIIGGTALSPSNLQICCQTTICGSSKPIDISLDTGNAKTISVNAGFKGAIAACKGSGIKIRVTIGETKLDVIQACDPRSLSSDPTGYVCKQ